MRKYRVECNYGSRYFDTAAKAFAYFNRKKSENLNVEIWLVIYTHEEAYDRYSSTQELLDYSFSKVP